MVYRRKDWPKKVYLCDIGLTKTLRFSENVGKLMENAVFLELLRLTSRKPMFEIYYWKSGHQGEVDFPLKESVNLKHLVRLTYAMGRGEVGKREVKSLLEASEKTSCNDLLMVTRDYEEEGKFDGKTFRFIPLWKWLLTT